MLSNRTVKYGTFAMLAANFAAAGALISHIEDQPQRDPEGLKPANVQVADMLKDSLDCTHWTPRKMNCNLDPDSLQQLGPIIEHPVQNIHANPGANRLTFTFSVLSKDHNTLYTISGNYQTVGQTTEFPDLYPTAVAGGGYVIGDAIQLGNAKAAVTPKTATANKLG